MKRRQLLAILGGTASLPFKLVAQERKLPRLAIVNNFTLAINVKTAKQLGISIPSALQASADELID
jgi:hypothetical protein